MKKKISLKNRFLSLLYNIGTIIGDPELDPEHLYLKKRIKELNKNETRN